MMRAGVIQYSHYYENISMKLQRYIKTELKLGEHRTKRDFDRAIDNMEYMVRFLNNFSYLIVLLELAKVY